MKDQLFDFDMNSPLDIDYSKADISTEDGKIKRYCAEYCSDRNIITWAYRIDKYEDFVRKVKAYTASAHEDNMLTEEDEDVIRTMYSRDRFNYMKEEISKVFGYYDEELLEEKMVASGDIDPADNYKMPIREILNGNFTKYDKSKLSIKEKIEFDVADLEDEEYDLYVDPKVGVIIPVFYNIATANLKWYSFCIYLKKLYAALNIDANPFLPLITLDKRLLGVDCLDETHTNEINGIIAAECENNIIFAVRECARFNSAEGTKERTELSLGDWTWLWIYAQCFNTYREAPRQTGKTFLMTMVFGIEFAISYKDLMAIVVHFKSSEAIKNRNKMLESANALPNYLKSHNIRAKVVKGVEKRMVGPDLVGGGSPKSENIHKGNILKTVAVGKTESTAEQAGRGDTSQLISADEINFISQIGVLLTALTFAHSTARTLAKKAGKRFGMHFTSTAGKLNTKHGKEMYDLIYNKMCMFEIELFAYNLKDLETYLKANSEVNFFVIKYDYDELGYTEEWLDERIRNSKSVLDIQVEIFQRWLSVDDSSLFNLELVKRLEHLTKKNLERNFMYKKNNLIKYYPTTPNATFEDTLKSVSALLWGVDVAAGGGDYSVIYACDMTTLKPVFMYKVNNLTAIDFGIVAIDIARYCIHVRGKEKLFVINPEQNGPGLTFVPMLMKEPDIEPAVFRHLRNYDSRVSNETMKPWHRQFSKDTFIDYGSNMKKKMDNGRNLRDVLFEDTLFELMDKYPYFLATPDLASEVLTLHRKGGKIDGRIEAKSGFHDDILCSALHCAGTVLLEENRRMLTRFYKYQVDNSKIINMAINSHIDTFDELNIQSDLDRTFEYEIIDIKCVNNISYQIMKVFRYKDNIRVEVKDKLERDNIIKTNQDILNAFNNMKHLSVKDFQILEKNRVQTLNLQNNKNTSNTQHAILENRTNSPSYRQANKYNTKAKMF